MAQKCSKDIIKIVHVTSVVMKLREYFLCAKTMRYVCASAEPACAEPCLRAEECTCMRRGALLNGSGD